MADIASRCGLSIKSVSRAINGEPGLSPATVERVLAVAERIGFRRNDLARSLRQGQRTGTIGIVLKDPATHFYDQVIRGIQAVAQARNVLALTASVLDPALEKDTVLALLARRIDGLLVVPTAADHSYLAGEARLGVPMVFLDRPPRGLDADVVLLDNAGGADAAVTHLLLHGHRRIAMIGDSRSIFTVAQRLRGYRRALRRARVRFDPALVRMGHPTADEAEKTARGLLDLADPPTAVFTANNRATIGAYRALAARGMKGALVGFDDFELADMLAPPVTVIAHDTAELGRVGADLLLDRIGGTAAPPQRIVLPTRLIARGSGEIPGPQRPGAGST